MSWLNRVRREAGRKIGDTANQVRDFSRSNPILAGSINPNLPLAGLFSGPRRKTDAEEQREREVREQQRRQQELIAAQQREADTFRSQIPNLERQFQESLTAQSRQGLMSDLAQNKQDFNRRGLLFSRAQDAREGQIRGAAAGQLAQARADVATNLRTQSQRMDAAAAAGQLGQLQTAQQIQDNIYRNALERVQMRNSFVNQGLQAGGSLIGAGVAARGSNA